MDDSTSIPFPHFRSLPCPGRWIDVETVFPYLWPMSFDVLGISVFIEASLDFHAYLNWLFKIALHHIPFVAQQFYTSMGLKMVEMASHLWAWGPWWARILIVTEPIVRSIYLIGLF